MTALERTWKSVIEINSNLYLRSKLPQCLYKIIIYIDYVARFNWTETLYPGDCTDLLC